ncbi:MAG: hypothetical protein MRQ13_01370 [Candidatus Midichloria sp.]|nr:hypothetical protein [Candidatus Midichloria sp.]
MSNSTSMSSSELAKKDPINLSAAEPQILNTNLQAAKTQSSPLRTAPKQASAQKPAGYDYDERLLILSLSAKNILLALTMKN